MADEDLSRLKIDKISAGFSRRRRRKPGLWIAASAAVVIAFFIIYRFIFNPITEVTVATVTEAYPSQSFTLLNASGYIVAQRKAAVASKITGRLEWIGVEEGSKVKKGQILARLEGKDAVAQRDQAAANLNNNRALLEQARAELEDAKINYDRNKELIEKGLIARMDYDTADARYKKAIAGVGAASAAVNSARAALENARVAVEYTLIRAPFDAVVLTKDADIGDIITPLGAAANAKAAVVTIADMSSLQVEADVSESNLEKVKNGQPAEIQLDALPESRFRGVVHMIVPTADRSKASVMVKVRFLDKDPRILPEMSAKVAFLEHPVSPEEQKPKTAVSPDAVVSRNGGKVVFTVEGNRAHAVPVKTGERIGDLVAVSGIKTGERVILSPPAGLRDGSRISVREK